MEILWVFLRYALITAAGLVAAKVLVHFVLSSIKRPDRPDRRPTDIAAESLRTATQLRMDATALYNQLSGRPRRCH